jgi:hypothetical protein
MRGDFVLIADDLDHDRRRSAMPVLLVAIQRDGRNGALPISVQR